MKKLFHYIVIFFIIYWCFNNISGCGVAKDSVSPAPTTESEEHDCSGCIEPFDEEPQGVLDNEKANTMYLQLKDAIIRTEGNPKSFVELNKEIEIVGLNIIVTIEYSIINDMNNRVDRKCIGTHKFTNEGKMIGVDISEVKI